MTAEVPTIPALPDRFFTFPMSTKERRFHEQLKFITLGNEVVESLSATLAWGQKPIEWDVTWEIQPEAKGASMTLGAERQKDGQTWLPQATPGRTLKLPRKQAP
ncbi:MULTISPECIES: hypothetical protein [unclassified Corallococcus]|uniref:hypothetical protein n=1 Tax=unclassified Corallococcus TaxID=2685029 RepID=UPI001A8D4C40|nr:MULTISPECIES: hypothetical protein [unclassified Corallococcus]MBN9681887.1 hypothetical protein [Corallococcus sp. NCSPR001]WAS86546.1 hypothetical protein O0N60_06110 [Corallococcus sp. NCRR]